MKHWWVPGLQIGYEHTFVHQVADFLQDLASGKPTSPTFREALATQAVCDAVLDSAEVGKWETSCRSEVFTAGPHGRRDVDLNGMPRSKVRVDIAHENRHEPPALDRPWSPQQHDALLDQLKAIGFDAVEIPVFNTSDLAPYERLGQAVRSRWVRAPRPLP